MTQPDRALVRPAPAGAQGRSQVLRRGPVRSRTCSLELFPGEVHALARRERRRQVAP